MHDIISKVKENSLPNGRMSEKNLESKFCNFFVDKITYIRNMPKNCNSFVLDRKKELGMNKIQSSIRILCRKNNRTE